jgi:hypothetical protein
MMLRKKHNISLAGALFVPKQKANDCYFILWCAQERGIFEADFFAVTYLKNFCVGGPPQWGRRSA